MSTEEGRAEVSVGATIDDAVAAIKQLTEEFEGFAKHTTEQLHSVSSVLGEVGEKVKGALEIFLSFEGIKESINATREFALETERLAARMGVGQSEASQFIVAIDDVGATVEQVSGIMQKMQRQLKSNEQGMNDLGLKTRDGSGHLKDQKDLYLDALEVLRQYKEGTDRNAAAMVLFGGRVGDLSKLLKQNRENTEEAAKKADALGLTMTKEASQGAETFRATLNDLHDILLGLQKAIGDALMPVLSSMGQWLTQFGPAAVTVFANAFKTLVSVLDIAWLALQQLLNLVKLVVRDFAVFTALIAEMFTTKPTEWGAVWKRSLDQMGLQWTEWLKDSEEAAKGWDQRMADRWGKGTKLPAPEGGKGAPDPKAREALLAEIESERAILQIKLQEVEEELKQEIEAHRMTEAEKASNLRAAQQATYEAERALLERKRALYGVDKENRAKATAEIAQLDEKHVLDQLKNLGEYNAGVEKLRREQVDLEADSIRQRLALTDEGYKREVAYLDELVETGRLKAPERLAIEHQLLEDVYQAKRAELLRETALYNTQSQEDKKKRQELDAELAKMDAQHGTDLNKNTTALVKSLKQQWQGLASSISSSLSSAFKSLLTGTTSLRDALKTLFISIAGNFIDFLVKNTVEKWLEAEATKTAATILGTEARTTAEAAGQSAGLAGMVASLGKAIMNYAAQAFAGVWAALSGIPVVGPALAAAGAPVAAATVAGAVGLLSAEGGFDVPAGLNPLTQLHEEEMVLPKDLANQVRRGGGKGGGDFHYHDHTGTLTDDQIQRNGRKIAKAMHMQARNFFKG